MVITVLEIIKLALEITLQIIKDMPDAEKQRLWAQHQKNLDFWQGLLDRIEKTEAPK